MTERAHVRRDCSVNGKNWERVERILGPSEAFEATLILICDSAKKKFLKKVEKESYYANRNNISHDVCGEGSLFVHTW